MIRPTCIGILLSVGILVSGCGSQGTRVPDSPITRAPERGGWFCQMSASGDGWSCVRDQALADDPRPDRLPSPAPPPEAPAGVPDLPAPAPLPGGGPDAGAPPDARLPGSGPEGAGGASRGEDAPRPPPIDASAAQPLPDDAPEHVRLAYRPARPTALTDLPASFYAVQLMAMSSKDSLEAFVAREGISNMSAARVERGGELFYVLLLGIYEDVDKARRAVASLPDEIGGSTPWIRPLGSLQSAMLRADRLAGSNRY
ncbi:MAG: hypothetical protein CMD39_09805 [Gammaproteobacteria bacterium]|nr:hypothetical protein [Gammaproteobacteria bacterium]